MSHIILCFLAYFFYFIHEFFINKLWGKINFYFLILQFFTKNLYTLSYIRLFGLYFNSNFFQKLFLFLPEPTCIANSVNRQLKSVWLAVYVIMQVNNS